MIHDKATHFMPCLVALICLGHEVFASRRNLESDLGLNGVGASFPGEVYESLTAGFESYRAEFIDIDTMYNSIGSGDGIRIAKGLDESPVVPDFFASDLPLTEEEYENYTNLAMAPMLAGPVVVAFNIPGVSTMNLTMDHVVGIYNGTYMWWNDTSIADINPGTSLPNQRIRVIARADTAGSTLIFTESLCIYSQDWCDIYGNFSEGLGPDDRPVYWDRDVINLYGRTNRGMSGIILSYRYSIGYISSADAAVSLMAYASLMRGETPVLPSVSALEAAVNRSVPHLGPRLTTTLARFAEPHEYPIIGYSYFLVYLNTTGDCQMQVELVRFMEWCLSDDFPADEARDASMAVVNEKVERLNDEMVFKQMYCDGELLHIRVDQQKYDEWISKQTWRLPVFIAAPIVGAGIIGLIIYISIQQARLRRALLSDEWKIDSDSIQVGWSRSGGLVTNNGPGSALSLNISSISHFSMTVSPYVWGVGSWQEKTVCLRDPAGPIDTDNKEIRKTLLLLRYKMQHANVLRLYGVTFLEGTMYVVSDHCPKGTLSDVVQNEKYRIDDNIKFSLALDVSSGMQFLHNQGMIHGRLRSDCCFIDSRWQVRVSDWEYSRLAETMHEQRKTSKVVPIAIKTDEEDPNVRARQEVFTAPELLRNRHESTSKASDVYSFSMILLEIFTREDPYSDVIGDVEPTELIRRVVDKGIRPNIEKVTPEALVKILEAAWQEDPDDRPGFSYLNKRLKAAKPTKKSVMDSMMEVLEGYVNSLEEKVSERTAELADANRSMENLLHQILPPTVASALARGETVAPESFSNVTIYFSDIVGFTKLSSTSTPMDIVNMLNDLYTTFDSVIENHDVYKVETIGDAYMVISGLPNRNGNFHASHIATMSLDLIAAAARFIIRHKPGERLQLRAGIHSGPVVAGVVGLKMPRYCLFGDTVNTASRMESTSEAMKIQASQTTVTLLEETGGFILQNRGEIQVKGKGNMKTYFLQNKEGYTPLNPRGNYEFRFLTNK